MADTDTDPYAHYEHTDSDDFYQVIDCPECGQHTYCENAGGCESCGYW